MRTVGIFDAKTHFSEIVADAMNGETTIVTRKGKPVAEIAPVRSDGRERIRRVLERIRRRGREICARNGGPIDPEQVKEWINEGRRPL